MNSYYQPYWLQEDELEHFGVLGMKWGIRRYQNKDGTLTEAGKKRYGTVENMRDVRQRSKERRAAAAKIAKAGVRAAAVIGLGMLSVNLMNSATDSILGTQASKVGTAAAKSVISSYGQTSASELNEINRVISDYRAGKVSEEYYKEFMYNSKKNVW